MRRTVNNIISVVYSALYFAFLKIFNWSNLSFYWMERFSPDVVVEIRRGGKLILGKRVRVHSGTKIKVSENGICKIDDDVKVNYNCMVICHRFISIGNGTEFGPSVYIYDHDHKFSVEVGVSPDQFSTAPVVIGRNVWIGAGTIILKGTVIGDNSVVGAGCVIRGTYPAGSVIVQKRETLVRCI